MNIAVYIVCLNIVVCISFVILSITITKVFTVAVSIIQVQ